MDITLITECVNKKVSSLSEDKCEKIVLISVLIDYLTKHTNKYSIQNVRYYEGFINLALSKHFHC